MLHWPTAMIRPKSQNLGHDSILTIRNFLLMIKNHISLQIFDCSDPVTGQQPKNMLPISVATRNFVFILFYFVVPIRVFKKSWIQSLRILGIKTLIPRNLKTLKPRFLETLKTWFLETPNP
jgi:hypothetical protein